MNPGTENGSCAALVAFVSLLNQSYYFRYLVHDLLLSSPSNLGRYYLDDLHGVLGFKKL